MAISADFIFSQMYTPFPEAKPSALTTKGNLLVFKNSSACFDFSKIPTEEMDAFIFHQANKLINDSIAKKAGLDSSKLISSLYEYGNTASASIPLTLGTAWNDLSVKSKWILISGFGVGFSIASAMINFNPEICEPPEEIELN